MCWIVISAMDSSVCTDEEKAMDLWTQAADLGSSQAHYHLGV